MGALLALEELVLAYALADAIGAVYHLLTDRGWNVRSQCVDFARHHERPETLTFDLRPMAVGIPAALAGFFVMGHPVFFLTLGISAGLSQLTHYWAHNPAPPLVRGLQWAGIFLRPEQHDRHHYDFDRDFSVLSGWNNGWVNLLARVVPYRTPLHDVSLFVGLAGALAAAATVVSWRLF